MIELLAFSLLILAFLRKDRQGVCLLLIFSSFYLNVSLYHYIPSENYWLYYVIGAILNLTVIKIITLQLKGKHSSRYILFNIISIAGNGLGVYLWTNYLSHSLYNVYFIAAYLLLVLLELHDVGFFGKFRGFVLNLSNSFRWNTGIFKGRS